jgi:hypothetical protein
MLALHHSSVILQHKGHVHHVMDAANMIDRRPLIDDHLHKPKVRVPAKQPQDIDEKWGLAIP